jgi:predicted N-acetyltransferase YhbS
MIDVRPLDLSPAGIEQTCGLLNIVYPNAQHITPTYLDRLYNGNPLGPTFGFSAFSEGNELVGHYLMIPLLARIHGVEERGIWPFQLATHPGFRGKGLFTALAEESFTAARERGFGYLSGVGNAMSTPLFVGKWGFQAICQLDVRIGTGPIPPRQEIQDLEFVRVWDPEGIAWRLAHSAQPYHVQYRGEFGHLCAPTGKLGVFVEIGMFERRMLPEGLPTLEAPHPFRLWIGVDPSRNWWRSPYFNVPVRFRPSPLNLLFYDLTDQKRVFDPARVRYDVFDFDAY